MNTVSASVLKLLFVSLHTLIILFSVYSYKADILNYINLASMRTRYGIILVYCLALNTVFHSTNAFRH